MATGTIILRPSQDVNVSHAKSSGSSGYLLIADQTQDGDSTYIYQTLSSTTSTTVNSTFMLSGNIPNEKINITAVRLYSCATKGNNGETATYNCYFAINTSNGGNDSNAATSATLGTSYAITSTTSSTLVTQINNYITSNNVFPTVSVKIATTGTKSSSKNSSNGYVRVTQVYMEVDYETIETSKIYLKENNAWKEYSKIYIKENNSWVEKSMSEISSIFSTTANYVKSS